MPEFVQDIDLDANLIIAASYEFPVFVHRVLMLGLSPDGVLLRTAWFRGQPPGYISAVYARADEIYAAENGKG